MNESPERPPIPWVGIVLVGGKSSRMGTDKAGLSLKGETLLERSVRVLRESLKGECEIFISGGAPIESVASMSVIHVKDLEPELGPLGGLHSVIMALKRRGQKEAKCLLLPVDMPGLTPEVLQVLVDAIEQSKAAFIEGHALPLAFHLNRQVFQFFESHFSSLSSDSKSFQTFGRFIGAESVPFGMFSKAVLSNVNTPEQWKEFCS